MIIYNVTVNIEESVEQEMVELDEHRAYSRCIKNRTV